MRTGEDYHSLQSKVWGNPEPIGACELTIPAARKPKVHVALITLYLYESLGARQLCSVLRERGHECSLVFMKEFRWGEFRAVTEREEQVLMDLLRELKPDLVGISLTSSFVADLSFAISEKVRAQLGVPVILGGAHPSACPEECLEHCDFVCRGEGEEALVDLCEALAAGKPGDDIPNIWAKVGGEIRRNDVRPLTDDLDDLPSPAFNQPGCYFVEEDHLQEVDPAIRLHLYHTYAARMACPFACTFCGGVWLRRGLYGGKGPVRRYRSVGRILEDIKQALQRHPNARMVQFWDEVFAVRAPKGWLDEFCERFPKEVGLPFGIWSHPAVITEKMVVQLKEAGLKQVVLGVESGSPVVRREVLNRRERNEAVLRAAEALHRHGIETGWDFILDIPWMTEENCRGTFELVMQLPQPFHLGLHSLSFLPQTEVTRRALEEGIIRPEQVSRADRPLPERFELHYWKYHLEAGGRSSAFWHSLIYLAGTPFVPKRLLWTVYRMRWLFRLWPRPLAVVAEAARSKQETGRAELFQALSAVYPGLAAFLARHPRLAGAANRVARFFGRLAVRVFRRGAG